MQDQNPIIIDQLIRKLINESPHKHKLEEASIINAWHQLMPKLISRRTEHIYVRGNKIFVKLNSAPLRQELHHTKQQILEMLQNSVKDYLITDVIFI